MLKLLKTFTRLSSTLKKMSDSNKEFISRRNPTTGKMEWVLLPEDYDYLLEIGRAAYADMLHDHDRNAKYNKALKWAIDKTKAMNKEAIVLDIGTGTGLLSMMAKRCGADEVYACEAFLPMLQCAKKVIKSNGFTESDIKLIPKRSTDLVVGVDLPKRCNILVTEVFDTELIGEGAVSTYNHAREELMEPGYLSVPMSSTIYIQYADSLEVEKFHIIDKEGLKKKMETCNGIPSVQDIQLSNLKGFKLLTDPIPVFEFNFTEPLPDYRQTITTTKPVSANAAFFYWTLKMDENETKISCEPEWLLTDKLENDDNKYQWRDHWIQSCYYLPTNIDKSIFSHDEFAFWFGESKTHPVCTCGLHNRIPRTRIHQLNCSKTDYIPIIQAISNINSTDTTIICISDETLLPFELKTRNDIIAWGENSFATIDSLKNNCKVVFHTSEETVPTASNDIIVVGDPYFNTSVNQWDNLRFFYQANKLKNVKAVFPNKCMLSIVAVEFEHLWKIKARVHKTCGLSLEEFDDLIVPTLLQTDNLVDPQPVWEYNHVIRSEIVPVMKFEYPLTKDMVTEGVLKTTGKVNAMIIYMEWFVDDKIIQKQFDESSLDWEKKNQGVYFINNEMNVDYSVKFCQETGDIQFCFK